MTDWADGIETRNYGIKGEIDAGMLSEFMRTIVALAIVAGALLFYSWVRSQIINIGYESQNLFTEEESLVRAQKRLILEEETLKDLERIDSIARNDLGMIPLHPNQWVLPQHQDAEGSMLDAIAMADSEGMGLERAALAKVSLGIPIN